MAKINKELKITVVGDEGVGKTSLIYFYETKQFNDGEQPSLYNIVSKYFSIDGKSYCINISDTIGHEDHDQTRSLSYPKTDCFVLCFAVNNRHSYENITGRWCSELHRYSQDIPIILLATKTDLRNNDPSADIISTSEGYMMKDNIHAVKFLECSVKNNKGIQELLEEILVVSQVSKQKYKRAGCEIM